MPIDRIITGAWLLVLLCGGPVLGVDTRFDGRFWRASGLQTRQLLVYSFVSGIVQGQDRVAQRLLVKGGGGFRPECHQAVSHNINRLEAELGRLDHARFITALDAFYEVKQNRKLELNWALMTVMQQVKGPAPSNPDRRIETIKPEGP